MPFAAAALLALAVAAAAGDPPALTDDDRADLAWLEGLGYPKVEVRKFVRAVQPARGQISGWEVRGFVVEETPEKVRIRCLGLDEHVVERASPGTPDAERVRVEPLDAHDAAEEWLHGGPSPTAPSRWWDRSGEPSVATQILVLAGALNASERDSSRALVHGLLAHARTLRHEHWRHWPDPDDSSRPLRERAASDLAAVELVRAKFALFGWSEEREPAARRRSELERFRTVARRFAATRAGSEAAETAALLERMVRDAEEHAKRTLPAESTSDERARELVFRLREQYADGPGAMGSPGMILTGPYKELVAMGRAAVPHLVEALADESLTRVGGYGRGIPDPYLLSVGDLAEQAIGEIAGRWFAPPPETKLPEGDRHAYRAAYNSALRPVIEAWLADVDAGRETESLAKCVADGDWQAAERLLKVDPERYSKAALDGFLAANHPSERGRMLDFLAKRPGVAGLAALRSEAESGDSWTRLSAATVLADAGDPAAPDLLLALWRERRDGGGPPTWVPDHSTGRDRDDELRMIVGPLLALRRPDLVAALGDALPTRGPLVRQVLTQELAKARATADGDFAKSIDEALASVLGDVEEYADVHGPEVRSDGLALRVKDAAAATLASSRGLAAPRLEDPLHVRDACVARVANAWRRSRGVADTAVPELPALSPVDPEEVRRIVAAYVASVHSADEFAARAKDIAGLPLAALPALRAAIPDVQSWSLSEDLRNAAGRLSFTVRAVRFAPEGASFPAALRERADALAGRPLTAPGVADLAWTLVRAAGDGVRGASLDVWRGTDDGGAVVTITLLEGSSGGWTTGALALRGDRFVQDGWGHGGWSQHAPNDDGTLLRMSESALASPPGERTWIHVSVVRRPYER